MKNLSIKYTWATMGTVGGWSISADKLQSAVGSIPPFGDGASITLDANAAAINLSAYSAGKRWNSVFNIWEDDPNSGQYVNSKITPKGIDIKSDANIVAAFRQMNPNNTVALQVEAPPGSVALNVIGDIAAEGERGLSGVMRIAPNGTRSLGIRFKNGIPVEIGEYLNSSTSYLPVPSRG